MDTLPLRSALKNSSRPTTPATSPPLPTTPLPPLSAPASTAASSSSNILTDTYPMSAPVSAVASGTSIPSSLYSSLSSSTAPLLTPPTASGASMTTTTNGGNYKPKVSFDTFENPAASMFSFTLQVHSHGYERTRETRTYLCAVSADPSGQQALAWALENLVQDRDELVVFRGFDADVLENDHDIIRNQARDFMAHIQARLVELDPDRKVSITIEFIAGKITQTIDRLIALYRPDSLVVGTRGPRGMMQTVSARFGATAVGGVSKYCLSHSPVPVIVVRPEAKVRKTLDKRRANPKRGKHFDDLNLRPRSSTSHAPTSAVPHSAIPLTSTPKSTISALPLSPGTSPTSGR